MIAIYNKSLTHPVPQSARKRLEMDRFIEELQRDGYDVQIGIEDGQITARAVQHINTSVAA